MTMTDNDKLTLKIAPTIHGCMEKHQMLKRAYYDKLNMAPNWESTLFDVRKKDK